MPCQENTEFRGVASAALGQHAVMVASARWRTFGLGMAQQQQPTHGFSGLDNLGLTLAL